MTDHRIALTPGEEDLMRRIRQQQRDDWWGCAPREPIAPKPSRHWGTLIGFGVAIAAIVVLGIRW